MFTICAGCKKPIKKEPDSCIIVETTLLTGRCKSCEGRLRKVIKTYYHDLVCYQNNSTIPLKVDPNSERIEMDITGNHENHGYYIEKRYES